jgi:hypothetical protein
MKERKLLLGEGRVYRINYGKGNPNNSRIHLVAAVEGQWVFKSWSRGHRSWRYAIEPLFFFELLHRSGRLQPMGTNHRK